jgi:hypothetical protein
MEGLKIPIGAPLQQLDRDLSGAKSKFKKFATTAENDVGNMSNGIKNQLSKIGPLLAATFSIGAIASFGKEVLNATAEFQKFEAVLGNTLGSSALAKLKLKEIQEFAAKTPFSVNELTSAFVKLANQGFKPTGDEMRKLGDLAASTGKSFDMLAEAILDAQTGEFERLKEFGIKAKDAGENVIFTFKGVQTTVEKSSEAIRNYVTSLGDAVGVSGSMSVISKTLTGKVSNLGDSWDMMLLSIGSNTTGIFTGAIDLISAAINKITEYNRDLNTASKFKIEDKGADRFFNALIPGLALFTKSNKDLKVDHIQAIQDELSGFVSKTTEGAKSANDFSVAIANLKTQGDKLLKEGWKDKNLVAAFKSIYEEATKTLKDGRREFLIEANKAAESKAAKDKIAAAAAAKASAEAAAKLKDLTRQLKEAREDLIIEAGNVAIERGDIIKDQLSKIQNNKDITGTPTSLKAVKVPVKPILDTNAAYTSGQILKDYFQVNLLPQISSSFKTFFDDILMHGEFSFKALGESIKNTFASVLANEATKGVLSLLNKKGEGEGGTGGGVIKALGSILGIGKAVATVAAPAAVAAPVAAGAVGAAAPAVGALVAGTAATGGLLLPILAAVGATLAISNMFKKKKVPMPAPSSSVSTSSINTGAVDISGGRVVFEISGVNLIGVLNRAGAKLGRYGTI